MHSAAATPQGDRIRWVEITETAVHPALAGHRSLLIDLLGHGISDRPTAFDYTLEAHADALVGP